MDMTQTLISRHVKNYIYIIFQQFLERMTSFDKKPNPETLRDTMKLYHIVHYE